MNMKDDKNENNVGGTHSEQCHVIPFLSPSELERLAILSEELGEAQQAIGKILRHGYESYHPTDREITNRKDLEHEIGDIQAAITIMLRESDISSAEINYFKEYKLKKVNKYLHHNEV